MNIKRTILEVLEEMGDVAEAILLSSMSSRLVHRRLNERERGKDRARQAIERMKKRGEVRVRQTSAGKIISLTKEGSHTLRDLQLDLIGFKQSKSWDGRWRLIMFDIPDNKKVARNALSFKLKKMGALRIQDSVYMYPYPCREEVDFIGDFFLIRRYITYLEASSFDGDEALRKAFSLAG